MKDIYVKIAERAESLGMQVDRLNLLMDIESADLKFNLRLEDLLKADNFNFLHDIHGICNYIVRDTFPATNFGCFVPRFAGRKVYYSIEEQVDACYKYLGLDRKPADEMTEEELAQAEDELRAHFEWVEHPACQQLVPKHIESGCLLFEEAEL